MKALALALGGLAVLGSTALAQTPESAAPRPAADWSLILPEGPEDAAYLAYGPPEGEDVLLSLSCKPKSGQVVATFNVARSMASRKRGDTWIDAIGRPAPWPVSVTVASLAGATTLRGVAWPNAKTGGSTVAVEVATRAPVIDEWKKTAALRLEAAMEKNVQPPAPKRLVSRFLRVCR